MAEQAEDSEEDEDDFGEDESESEEEYARVGEENGQAKMQVLTRRQSR